MRNKTSENRRKFIRIELRKLYMNGTVILREDG